MRALSRALSAATLIVLMGIYIEVPGPWRTLTPEAFGMTEIAPGVFTDAPERKQILLQQIRNSRDRAQAMFGVRGGEPRYVLCVRDPCAQVFGFRAAGLTFAYHFVLIAPHGLNDEVLLHERIHVELHRRMGYFDLVAPRFPTWFDEGLATLLSRPPRVLGRGNPAASDWVREGKRWWSWHRLGRARSLGELYTAATILVGHLQDRLGRNGLFDFIDQIEQGADFDALYADAMANRP